MPSLYEGFGFPIVEANAADTPVLTSNVSSMPEIAGDAAHLVDPLSVLSIQEGLESLITDCDYRYKLTRNASINAARFTWSRAAKLMYTAFERV